MNRSSLQRTTLVAGIVTGVVGLLLLLFPHQVLDGAYQDAGITNTGYHVLASLVSAVASLCVPFSAALVGAFLIMRHAGLVRNGGFVRKGGSARIDGAQDGREIR